MSDLHDLHYLNPVVVGGYRTLLEYSHVLSAQGFVLKPQTS